MPEQLQGALSTTDKAKDEKPAKPADEPKDEPKDEEPKAEAEATESELDEEALKEARAAYLRAWPLDGPDETR